MSQSDITRFFESFNDPSAEIQHQPSVSSDTVISTDSQSKKSPLCKAKDQNSNAGGPIRNTRKKDQISPITQRIRKAATFQDSWKSKFPWLRIEERDPPNTSDSSASRQIVMFCSICEKIKIKTTLWSTTGCTMYKADYLRRHEASKEHSMSKEASLDPLPSEKPAISSSCDNLSKGNIISQLRNTFFLSQHNFTLNILNDFTNFITFQSQNQNDTTNTSNKELLILRSPRLPSKNKNTLRDLSIPHNYLTYSTRSTNHEFLEINAKIVEKAVVNEINKSLCWSLLIDESVTNSSTSEKILTLASKHVVDDLPVLRFLGLLKISSTSADSLLVAIDNFISQKGLNTSTLLHFGSVGSSNVSGVHYGLFTLLKQRNPFLSSNHCVVHRVHMAIDDATKDIPYFQTYKDIVKAIYTYFSDSYRRMYELRDVEENIDNPDLFILNKKETSWLSWAQVIQNFHVIIDDIYSELESQSGVSSMAKFLYDSVDTEFYIVTKFLADIMETLMSMINVFQSDYVSLGETRKQLNMVIETITTNFIGTEFSTPNYGIVVQFSLNIIQSLRHHFPTSHLYHAMRILDPSESPDDQESLRTYGDSDVKFLADFYGISKPITLNNTYHPPIIDNKGVIREWQMAKYLIHGYRNYSFMEAWKKIWVQNFQFKNQFPQLTKLVEIVLTMPISNGTVERVFFRQNLIRDELNPEILSYYLHLSLNAPESWESFDYEKAYEYWSGLSKANK
ncbi:17539_t:CDS:2 [Cetraspora pellucida]|uniref:17539_t:CDS:1 n=1 Tax=Cetraspora pellucida TaxID=1433469 RepID=A0A9N9F975_9GLOM|nr:17539_t:CDS:2 [Cetraspora pellucida]